MRLSSADQEREARIAATLAAAWSVELWPMPALAFVDFLAVRDARPVGWVEVKSRTASHDELMALGGVALLRESYLTLAGLGLVPLSVNWNGARVVFDLAGELWWAPVTLRAGLCETHIRDRTRPGRMEHVVLFTKLRRVEP
jgi:hypothetical protein